MAVLVAVMLLLLETNGDPAVIPLVLDDDDDEYRYRIRNIRIAWHCDAPRTWYGDGVVVQRNWNDAIRDCAETRYRVVVFVGVPESKRPTQ